MSEYAQGGYIESPGPIPDWLLGDPGFLITAEQLKRLGLPDAVRAQVDQDGDDDE